AGEPGEREIEGTPEEMHRARLAQGAPREALEDSIGVRQHPEGALGLAGLVRRVRPILGERDRMVHLHGHGPDLHGDPELAQQALVLPVEFGDRLGPQRRRPARAIARLEHEPVVDEVELDRERSQPVRHRGRRQPPRGQVQRDVPPMVLPGREREPRLADDLHPHVKRVVGRLPFGERQAGPRGFARRVHGLLDARWLYFFSWATAASAAAKPILLWVPSQKGLVVDAPHRHSAIRGPRALVSTLFPSTSTSSISPSTRYGPLGRMVTLTGIDAPPEMWVNSCLIQYRDHAHLDSATRASQYPVGGDPVRPILTVLTAILLLLPCPALGQSVLRIGLNDDQDALDPTISRAYTGRLVFAALCDKLFDVTPDLKIVPQLATGYEWASDRKSIVIKLRPGVRFQDGEPFNAESVKFNIERHQNTQGSFRKPEIGEIVSVDVVNDLTVRFNLSQPLVPLLAALTDRSGMMVSPKAAKALGDKLGTQPVCAGPYK